MFDSASNRNEYQENLLGVKAAGDGWQHYHIHVAIVLKSGSLNLLEPPGPVQVCNGFALPLPLHFYYKILSSWEQNRTFRTHHRFRYTFCLHLQGADISVTWRVWTTWRGCQMSGCSACEASPWCTTQMYNYVLCLCTYKYSCFCTMT